MKAKIIDVETWMKENKGKLFKDSDANLVKQILSKGAKFSCSDIACAHTWQAKSGEVYLSCPKCGRSVVSFHLRKLKESAEICGTTDWDQEDM